MSGSRQKKMAAAVLFIIIIFAAISVMMIFFVSCGRTENKAPRRQSVSEQAKTVLIREHPVLEKAEAAVKEAIDAETAAAKSQPAAGQK